MTARVLLDRDIDKKWMDAALRLPDIGDVPASRAAIDAILEGTYLGKEARQKTLTAIARSWITPTDEGLTMTRGARELSADSVDLVPLHFGVLLATQPFFADAARAVGTAMFGDDEVDTNDLRRRMSRTWGTRGAVDRSVQANVKTMRSMGVLRGEPSSSFSSIVRTDIVDPNTASWLIACTLVSREAASIDGHDIPAAPELFAFNLTHAMPRASRWLTRHTEGGNRPVFELRGHNQFSSAGYSFAVSHESRFPLSRMVSAHHDQVHPRDGCSRSSRPFPRAGASCEFTRARVGG